MNKGEHGIWKSFYYGYSIFSPSKQKSLEEIDIYITSDGLIRNFSITIVISSMVKLIE